MNLRDDDQLDLWLDEALRQYGKAEARAGLEGRILANLAIAGRRKQARIVWAWVLASASAAILFAATWVWVGRPSPPRSANMSKRISADSGDQGNLNVIPLAPPKPEAARRLHSKHVTAVAEVNPRLDQFPSRRPFSQRELLIAEYAQRFPQEAVLMAKEQEKFAEEVRQAQEEVEKGSPRSGGEER